MAQNIDELYEEAVKGTLCKLLRYEDLHKRCSCPNITEKSTFFPPDGINQAESFREEMLQDRQAGGHFQQSELPAVSGLLSVRGTFAMIISYSGETAQMLEIARQCKRSEHPSFALTSFGETA